jgi:hypothetical protein
MPAEYGTDDVEVISKGDGYILLYYAYNQPSSGGPSNFIFHLVKLLPDFFRYRQLPKVISITLSRTNQTNVPRFWLGSWYGPADNDYQIYVRYPEEVWDANFITQDGKSWPCFGTLEISLGDQLDTENLYVWIALWL